MKELTAKILQFASYTRSLTLKNVSNFILLRTSYRLSALLKRPVLLRPPAYISIEPVNFCNLACPECPTGNGSMTRPAQSIDFASASAMIHAMKDYLLHINFYFQGEPFMYKQLHLLIREASRLKISTAVSTNGHFITSASAEEIVLSGLSSLIVSFDGYSQESYTQYRRNGDFTAVTRALRHISDAKRKHRSRYPVVCAQVLVLSSTENHLTQIKQLAYQSGADSVSFKTAQFYSLDTRDELLPKKAKSRYLNTSSGYAHAGKARNRCWRAWSNPVVCSDGSIVPCCYDKNAGFAFGNISEVSSLKTWSNNLRSLFLRKIVTERNSIEMCKNCPEGRSFFG